MFGLVAGEAFSSAMSGHPSASLSVFVSSSVVRAIRSEPVLLPTRPLASIERPNGVPVTPAREKFELK